MSWEMKALGDVCSLDKCQGNYTDLPYVGMEDITSHTSIFTGSLFPRKVKSSTFKFSNEHLLYGRLRPYLNKVLTPNFLGHCSTEVFPIKPSEKLDRSLLRYWFINLSTVSKINDTCTGTRMPRSNIK